MGPVRNLLSTSPSLELQGIQLVTSGIAMQDLLANYLEDEENVDDPWLTLEAAQQDLEAFSPCRLTHARPRTSDPAVTPPYSNRTQATSTKLVLPRPDWKRLERTLP
jgi:hypothetical protein